MKIESFKSNILCSQASLDHILALEQTSDILAIMFQSAYMRSVPFSAGRYLLHVLKKLFIVVCLFNGRPSAMPTSLAEVERL